MKKIISRSNSTRVFGKEYALSYDYFYQDKDYEKECDFIESIFKKFSGNVKTILDLGSGTGGHALILAKRGYYVMGVDRSKEMLEIAKSKAKKENLSIEFIHGNITDIDLHQKFDAIISMFAVISYQTTNSALAGGCKVASKHLVSDGLFLFDCWNGSAVLTEKPTVRVKKVELKDNKKIIRFTDPILNTMNHTVETRFKIWKIENDHLIDETNESHFMRFFFPQEIRYFLEIAGFSEVEFCPFLELEKTLTEHDWNMAVIARR
ncbi:class I SAM-dependent methyltransferase [candidate division WOR-3 bacterium]|nr:class I SAM-dependent methyltransferase [candidate division WOR-3 bacterium]